MTKKVISVFMVFMMTFALASCGENVTNESSVTDAVSKVQSETNTQTGSESKAEPDASSAVVISEESSQPSESNEDVPEVSAKTLIVYFSWSSSGNTEIMANTIHERTGGDLLRIEPLEPYPTDYSECGDVAKVERDENARPQIADLPDTIDEYDAIFVGYPIWWHTAPMIIGTFLESYDLSGKDIYPFSQSSSMDTEQFANSMDFVRNSAQGVNVHDGLFVSASDTEGILAYLTQNGYTEQ